MYNPTQRLMRSRTDRVLAGVAGGIAAYFAVDPVIIRLGFIVLLFTGAGVLLYPILWLIMPVEGSQRAAPEQAIDEMRDQAERVGDQMRDVLSGTDARRPHYNSATGQPVADETEIPINNLGGENAPASTDRNRQIGILLLGFGALALGSFFFGPAFGKILFPLLLIGAGIFVLRRNGA
jgi:phage shock protein C